MKKLASLLTNQTIRVDNHDSGSGRPFEWGTGVHIHKIMNEKKYKGAEFTLSLDRAGNINYIRGNDKSGAIVREIRKAFKDEQIRKKFITSLGEAFKTIADTSSLKKEERKKMLIQSSKQLIKLFGEKHILGMDWFRDDNNFIAKFINPTEPNIYIEQNTKDNTITFSNTPEYIELFNDIFKKHKEDKNETDE